MPEPLASFDYKPNVAIVTGAAQGIGYSIAIRLADDGVNIALNDIPSKAQQLETVRAEIEAKGRKAIVVPADVSQEKDVSSMVETVAQALGSVDIVSASVL